MSGPGAGSRGASGGADVILGAGMSSFGGAAGTKLVCSMRVESMIVLLSETKRSVPAITDRR
jgi:hypothetical protein